MFEWIRRKPNLMMAGAIVGVALLIFIFVWFEPHKAFIDERVDEVVPQAETVIQEDAAPTTSSDSSAGTTPLRADETSVVVTTLVPPVAYPVLLSQSVLIDVAHGGSGTVLVLELEDGSRVLRFEDLDVLNGPDLVVILSDRSLSGADDYTDGQYLILGELKGNLGNQNYQIPAEVDLSEWATAAIWCRRFNTTFNVASINGS
ncbi:MAG: DM13 domain-containing protein [Acidobacteria bacterium]|nr:DM13 domain-containing protein [Acidobacteriota bacterium]